MNSQLVRHTLQEDLYSSKNYSSKDHMFQLLGERTAKNFESSSYSSFESQQKNNIDELLRCLLCAGKVKNAHMCPNCSKLCCGSCFKKWLTEQKSQCPHCRCSLRVSQLVNCRFVNEITTAIEQTTKKEDEAELCSTHQVKMGYFCKTCQLAICSDCAMFGTEHKGHEFDHISKIYDYHVDQIKGESQGLQKRLKELTTHLNTVESTIDKLKKAKEEKVSELTVTLEQMHQRLDQELKSKQLVLLQQKTGLSDEIEFLESVQNEINQQIGQAAKSHLISKSTELVKMLREINNKPLKKYDTKTVSTEFTSEIVPAYDSASFELKNFSKLKQTQEIVYSEVLNANGIQWRLKIYPNGNGVAKGAYLSVFLEMVKGSQHPSKYEYRVEMMNQKNPNVVILREFSSEFESGECWGYNRFFKLDLLEKEGYLTESDIISLKYYVRAPSYYQQYQDQRRYIQQLENSKNQSNALIAELKEKLKKEMEKNKKLEEQKLNRSTLKSQPQTERQTESKTEECKEEANDAVLVPTSENKKERSNSQGESNTSRKEGSTHLQKEMVENIEEGPLDGVFTQKKDEVAVTKLQNLEEDEENCEKIVASSLIPEVATEKNIQQESVELDGNYLVAEEKQLLVTEVSEKNLYMTSLEKDLMNQSARQESLLNDQLSQSKEEIGQGSDSGTLSQEKKTSRKENIIENQTGQEREIEEIENEEEVKEKEKEKDPLDDIDLDNICERKVDVDFEPIEIERFGGKDREISNTRTQVKKNLLPNFDAEHQNDKKLRDKFTSSIDQFSESLMKKIENIKNEKYKRMEQLEDRRKPLSQTSKLNLLHSIAQEYGNNNSTRAREFKTKYYNQSDLQNATDYLSHTQRERFQNSNLY